MKRRFHSAIILGITASTAFSGCSLIGPDFTPPPVQSENQWMTAQQDGVKSDPSELAQWWIKLNDPVLNQLIQKAYEHNLSLRTLGLRVLEAKARLAQSVGDLYPQQQALGGDFMYNRTSEHNAAGIGATASQAQFGFSAAWEIDFWGKIRRAIEAQDTALLNSAAAYDAGLVSLLGKTASTYVLIRTTETQLQIARDNVAIQKESMKIAEARFHGGLTGERDYQQALTQLRATEATIPTLEKSLEQQKHALSLLLGEPPGQIDAILASAKGIPTSPENIAAGIPAELIRRRPDIRAAEFAAASECAKIGVAKGDLYPAFSISGTFGFLSSDQNGNSIGDIVEWKSRTGSVGPSFNWNVLNYGQLSNAVRAQDARFQQAITDYQNTVLTAQADVEDSLVAFIKAKAQVDTLTKAVDAARATVHLSVLQYDGGVTDYTTVITAQQNLLQEQDQLAQAQGAVPSALIAVYQSLGGGWEIREGHDFVPENVKDEMKQRTDWGSLLETAPVEEKPSRLTPTW